METIYIIGYYGSYVSIIGRVLSSRKNLSYMDIRKFIEEHESKTIEKIYEENGIDYIIKLAKYAITNSVKQGMIVSVPVEVLSDEELRHLIKRTGRVIFLKSKPINIYNNLYEEYEKIPALKNNFSIFTIEKELAIYNLYFDELENFIVEIDDKNIDKVLSEVLAVYNLINKKKWHIYVK